MRKGMKNFLFIGLGIGLFMTLSLTLNQGKHDSRIGGSSGVVLMVPAKPSSTVFVQGVYKMNQYLQKGYQVQEAVGTTTQSQYQYFLMVKY